MLTDNEIIKALECCEDSADTDKHCLKCPYCNESYCLDKMMADALSLINRQKAEIEKLELLNASLRESCDGYSKACDVYKAEIERLQKHIQDGIDLAKQIPEMVALAQAEAIKEFAER